MGPITLRRHATVCIFSPGCSGPKFRMLAQDTLFFLRTALDTLPLYVSPLAAQKTDRSAHSFRLHFFRSDHPRTRHTRSKATTRFVRDPPTSCCLPSPDSGRRAPRRSRSRYPSSRLKLHRLSHGRLTSLPSVHPPWNRLDRR